MSALKLVAPGWRATSATASLMSGGFPVRKDGFDDEVENADWAFAMATNLARLTRTAPGRQAGVVGVDMLEITGRLLMSTSFQSFFFSGPGPSVSKDMATRNVVSLSTSSSPSSYPYSKKCGESPRLKSCKPPH